MRNIEGKRINQKWTDQQQAPSRRSWASERHQRAPEDRSAEEEEEEVTTNAGGCVAGEGTYSLIMWAIDSSLLPRGEFTDRLPSVTVPLASEMNARPQCLHLGKLSVLASSSRHLVHLLTHCVL